MNNKKVSTSRLSMSRVRHIREMKRRSGNNSPVVIRTYQIPDSNGKKLSNDAMASIPSKDDVSEQMEELSVTQPPSYPNTSCIFERAKVWKNKEEDSDEKTGEDTDKVQYIPFIPSYLTTQNASKETAAVTPSPPKRKRSTKTVSFNKDVQYINDDDTVKMGNKKTKRNTGDSPSHDTVCVSNDKAWRYDDDDVLYSSDS